MHEVGLPVLWGSDGSRVSQRGMGQRGASAKHTHSPQASKKCPLPPSRSRNVFCLYLWLGSVPMFVSPRTKMGTAPHQGG